MRNLFYSIFFILILTVLLHPSCSIVKKVQKTVQEASDLMEDRISQSEQVIDDAIGKFNQTISDPTNLLGAEAQNYRRILEELQSNLPNEAREIINTDINELIQNSIALVGVETRCNVDFFGRIFISKLENLKVKILGGEPTPFRPHICIATPASIDMTLSPNQRNKISITGFDLDKTTALKVFLVGNNGDQFDFTSKVSEVSTYQLVYNLGANGIPVSASSAKIQLRFNNDVVSEIPVIQKQLEPCNKKDEVVNVSTFSCSPRSYSTIGNESIRGLMKAYNYSFDKLYTEKWKNEGADIKIQVYLKIDNGDIYAVTSMDIEGFKLARMVNRIPNFLVFVKSFHQCETLVYSPPNGYKIVKIKGATRENLSYTDDNTSNDEFPGTSGLVKLFVVKGIQKKGTRDVGGKTGVNITLNNINVVLEETGDCL